MRLSRISAWLSLASPLMTLMKSKTTRRSHPMMRSRLRKPTSKSMTTVFLPRWARPVANAAADVVLPTPPLPEVTTTTCAKRSLLIANRAASAAAHDDDALLLEDDLQALAEMRGRDVFMNEVAAGDAHQLGLETTDEDACRRVARRAGDGASAQRAVDVNVAVGDDLRAGAHRAHDDDVAARRVDLRARAHRFGDEQRLGVRRRAVRAPARRRCGRG